MKRTKYIITCNTIGCDRFGKYAIYDKRDFTLKQIRAMGLNLCHLCHRPGQIVAREVEEEDEETP